MSHCGTSTFDNHFDYRLNAFKDIQHSTGIRILWTGWNVINVRWSDVGVLDWYGIMHVWLDSCRRVSPCYLMCCWSLFRIIFYNVTSELDPAFVLLILRFQLRILEMTQIHQRRKMNFSALIFLLPRSPLSCFWISSTAMPRFSPVFPNCCLCIWIFFAWSIGMNLWSRL